MGKFKLTLFLYEQTYNLGGKFQVFPMFLLIFEEKLNFSRSILIRIKIKLRNHSFT